MVYGNMYHTNCYNRVEINFDKMRIIEQQNKAFFKTATWSLIAKLARIQKVLSEGVQLEQVFFDEERENLT